jgi:allantoinase
MSFDWILRSRRVVTAGGTVDAAIAMEGEKIAGVLASHQIPSACPLVDVGAAVVSPGLVDTHVHVNEPGRTEWEGFETATAAAAAGGITTIVDMPLNSSPVTTTAAALEAKMRAAAGRIRVDCGFWGGLVPDNADSLDGLIDAGVCGVKAFLVPSGIDDFPRVTEGDLRRAMPRIARWQVPLLVHAEIESPAIAPSSLGDPRRYATYLSSRPPRMEVEAVDQMVRLCRELRCPVHVVHLSSAAALEPASRARQDGLPFTLETCPHYLILAAEEIPEKSNQDRLWKALADQTIDFIVSDHSPCTPALKLPQAGDFPKAWGGIASLQFSLPLIWTHAKARGFGFEDLARWMSTAPAKLAGVEKRKGIIAPGYDADLVVWNPEGEFTVSREMIQHRHTVTPYLGRSLSGIVEMTILRGRKIYERGKLLGAPSGQTLLGERRRPSGGMHG